MVNILTWAYDMANKDFESFVIKLCSFLSFSLQFRPNICTALYKQIIPIIKNITILKYQDFFHPNTSGGGNAYTHILHPSRTYTKSHPSCARARKTIRCLHMGLQCVDLQDSVARPL